MHKKLTLGEAKSYASLLRRRGRRQPPFTTEEAAIKWGVSAQVARRRLQAMVALEVAEVHHKGRPGRGHKDQWKVKPIRYVNGFWGGGSCNDITAGDICAAADSIGVRAVPSL